MKTLERHLFHDRLSLPFPRSRRLFRPPSKDVGSRCQEHMESTKPTLGNGNIKRSCSDEGIKTDEGIISRDFG